MKSRDESPMKIQFVTENGIVFNTRAEAEDYERRQDRLNTLRDHLNACGLEEDDLLGAAINDPQALQRFMRLAFPPPAIQLQMGRRYVRRGGGTTGPLTQNPIVSTRSSHPFWDSSYLEPYTPNGMWSMYGDETPLDLVKEYKK